MRHWHEALVNSIFLLFIMEDVAKTLTNIHRLLVQIAHYEMAKSNELLDLQVCIS